MVERKIYSEMYFIKKDYGNVNELKKKVMLSYKNE
jgi:hypothetical protein